MWTPVRSRLVLPRVLQVSNTGAPYAFYARPLHGYPDGFPVMLPNLLSEGRLNQTLTLLQVRGCKAPVT
jgi:hypothetical protein